MRHCSGVQGTGEVVPTWLGRVPTAGGGLAAAIGLVALAGWATGLDPLIRFVPGWATLKVNTALALVALGLSLLVPRGRPLAAAAGALAVATAAQWLVGVDLGIDELFARDPESEALGAPPGRMAAATSTGLALAAGAVLSRARPALGQALGAATVAVAGVAVLGYAYELRPLAEVWSYGTVSLPTALALVALGTGAACLRPAEGPMRAITGPEESARLLRRLGPAAILLPAVTGLAALRLERALGWPPAFSLAAGVTLDAVAFAGLLAATAAGTRRAEARVRELAQRRLEAQEDERRAVARELHDELGQSLTALSFVLERVGRSPRADEEARALLESMTAGVRSLALDLRPSALDDLGLVPAVHALASRWSERTGTVCAVATEGGARRYSAPVETAAYRIVQEALTNVARHAHALHVRVRLASLADRVDVEVSDDGQGFDTAGLDRHATAGLEGMRERAKLLGGGLRVSSGPGGTTVAARLPAEAR